MTSTTALKKITTEHSGTVFTLPYLVARDLGYFADEGLDVEFVRRRGDQQHAAAQTGGRPPAGGFLRPVLFEKGEAALYRACEWGQVRRSQDSAVGGRIISKRSAVAVQAIVVRPDSPVTHPQDLRHKTVGVELPPRLALHHPPVARRFSQPRRNPRRPRQRRPLRSAAGRTRWTRSR